MIKKRINISKNIQLNQSYIGETIEEKMRRVMDNKEPIKDGSSPVYTARKDGVLAATNIRTDRMEIAIEAMDKVARNRAAKRDNVAGTPEQSGSDSLQGTDLGKSEIDKN